MEDWKEKQITEINDSRKLNDKKKKHMIKLVTKSKETDYKSFFSQIYQSCTIFIKTIQNSIQKKIEMLKINK